MVLFHDLLIASNILFKASFSSGLSRLSRAAWQERLAWRGEPVLSHPAELQTWFCCGCHDAPDHAQIPVGTTAGPSVNQGGHQSREGVSEEGLGSEVCSGPPDFHSYLELYVFLVSGNKG